nr:hypothetical protein [Modestobacter roseus]
MSSSHRCAVAAGSGMAPDRANRVLDRSAPRSAAAVASRSYTGGTAGRKVGGSRRAALSTWSMSNRGKSTSVAPSRTAATRPSSIP